MITTTPMAATLPATGPAEPALAIPGDMATALPPFAELLEAALDPAAAETDDKPAARPAAKRAAPKEEPGAALTPANVPLPVRVELPVAPATVSKSGPETGLETGPEIGPEIRPATETKFETRPEPKPEPKLDSGSPPPAAATQTPPPAAVAAVAAPAETASAQPQPDAVPPPVLAPAASEHHKAPAPHAHPMRVAAPIHAPGFDEAFAAHVTVAVRAGTGSASIALNPPELGPVEMRVSVAEGEARVAFAAEQPLAREAIAEALPRLREMLSAHGLSLADASVGAELPRRGPQAQDALPARNDPPEESEAATPERTGGIRLVDVFA